MSKQEQIKEYLTSLQEFHLPEYEQLPDLDLYMDQVLTYISKTVASLGQESQITGSMINNYVKGEIIPSPKAKKYNAEHMSKILSILFLKPTFSMIEIKSVFDNQNDAKSAYEFLKNVQEETFKNINEYAKNELSTISIDSNNQLQALATKFAINSYAYKLIAEKLLQFIEKEHPIDTKEELKEVKKRKKKKQTNPLENK